MTRHFVETRGAPDRHLVDCIRAWHMSEHGQAVSGAISDVVSRLVRSQNEASEAAADVATAAEDYGPDSAETEQAIGVWLAKLSVLTKNYQALTQKSPAKEPRGQALVAGLPPSALVLSTRGVSSVGTLRGGAPPLSYDERPPLRGATSPAFTPSWPAGVGQAPRVTPRPTYAPRQRRGSALDRY